MRETDSKIIDLDKIVLSIERMYTLTQIPLSIVNSIGKTIYCLPESEHHFLPQSFGKSYIKEFKGRISDDAVPLMLSRKSGVLIGVIHLSKENYLIIGPITSYSSTWEEMNETYHSVLTEDELLVLKRVFESLTPMDTVRFANLLSSLVFSIKSVNLLPAEILTKNYIQEKKEYTLQKTKKSEKITVNLSSDSLILFENKVLSAIRTGNIDALTDAWRFPAPAEDINHILYFAVPFLTLISRAAIEGGADSVSVIRNFYESVDTISKKNDKSFSLVYSMEQSYTYCNMVRQALGRNLMPSICRECERYIHNHISEKITVDQLTKVCGVSKRKLYSVFEANFHITINEYIQKERIKKAKFLLDHSNYTMAQISSSLGYATQSYFITSFEKFYHCTPGEYLKKIKYYNFVVHWLQSHTPVTNPS